MFWLSTLGTFLTYFFVTKIPTTMYYVNSYYHKIMMTVISLILFLWALYFCNDLLSQPSVSTFWHLIETDKRYQLSYFPYLQQFVVFSKVLEWIDTLLLKQNNKKIGNLHFFHHMTIVSAFYYGCYIPGFVVTGLLNSFIHIFMYLYYLKPNKYLSQLITIGQILQLIGNTIFNMYGIFLTTSLHKHTDVVLYSIYCSICTFCYLCLFIDFYLNRYYKTSVKKILISNSNTYRGLFTSVIFVYSFLLFINLKHLYHQIPNPNNILVNIDYFLILFYMVTDGILNFYTNKKIDIYIHHIVVIILLLIGLFNTRSYAIPITGGLLEIITIVRLLPKKWFYHLIIFVTLFIRFPTVLYGLYGLQKELMNLEILYEVYSSIMVLILVFIYDMYLLNIYVKGLNKKLK